jgi:RNase adapter protein RapZ
LKTLKTIIFTGVSGGGKTTALRAVEDLGFYCVDNLPLPLLGEFVETMRVEPLVERAALVVDARLRSYVEGYALASMALRSSGYPVDVVYLDARDDVLVRRFSQTRRRHPLGGDDLMAVLQEERALLAPLRAQAVTCIDTTDLTVHDLKEIIQDRYMTAGDQLTLSLLSFGFRHGLPSFADLVFDVRFLANPFFVDELRHLTGVDAAVADYVLSSADCVELLDRLEGLFNYLLPRYQAEGKVYLTAAIGCTGGQHRSVAVAEALAKRLAQSWTVRVRHRDIQQTRRVG